MVRTPTVKTPTPKKEKRILRELPQVGKSDKARDKQVKALLPGKRVSKTGKIYWETRANRSDKRGKLV